MATFTVECIQRILRTPTTIERRQSLAKFLRRIYSISQVNPTVISIGLYYFKRFMDLNPQESQMAASGLFVTALILANHYLDDHAYTNKTWSKVTGVNVRVLNATQRLFLSSMDYRLNIEYGELCSWTKAMQDLWTEMFLAPKAQEESLVPEVKLDEEAMQMTTTAAFMTSQTKRKREMSVTDLQHSLKQMQPPAVAQVQ